MHTEDFSLDLFRYEAYTLNQLQKAYPQFISSMVLDSNTRKVFSKIQDQITTHFRYQETKRYLQLFFYLSKEVKPVQRRHDMLARCSTMEVSSLLPENVQDFDERYAFPGDIITIDASLSDRLYEQFGVQSQTYGEEELHEMIEQDGIHSKSVILSEKRLYTEFPEYTFDEFRQVLRGFSYRRNQEMLRSLLLSYQQLSSYHQVLQEAGDVLGGESHLPGFAADAVLELLDSNPTISIDTLRRRIRHLDEEVDSLNAELKEAISTQQVSLEGEDLVKLLQSGDVASVQEKVQEAVKERIRKREQELVEEFRKQDLSVTGLFVGTQYPVELDVEVQESLLQSLEQKYFEAELTYSKELGSFSFEDMRKLWNLPFLCDLLQGIVNYQQEKALVEPVLADRFKLLQGRHLHINRPKPIDYGLGIEELNGQSFKGERLAVITGANSGGKTTLLEMIIQIQLLASMGIGIPAQEGSEVRLVDEIIYLKKFSGTAGAGAFEQTIRHLLEILESTTAKLVLIDEFEAITEPGAAAKILTRFLRELRKQEVMGIAVSHLGQEISAFLRDEQLDTIRIDGISAEGLDEKGHLLTNHQPAFYQLGKSTPELILKRVLQDQKFWKDKSQQAYGFLEELVEHEQQDEG